MSSLNPCLVFDVIKATQAMMFKESEFVDQLPCFQLPSLADRTKTDLGTCLIDAVGTSV